MLLPYYRYKIPKLGSIVPIFFSSRNFGSRNNDDPSNVYFQSSSQTADTANKDFVDTYRKKPQCGTRFLKDNDNVYRYNAWDHVDWDEAQLKAARDITDGQLECRMSDLEFKKIEEVADEKWDEFYKTHDDKFYKDRQWLFTEFPELTFENKTPEDGKTIFEIGCGVGNTIFPILQTNTDHNLHVYCCDFSQAAITILREDEAYSERCTAFVLDVTKDDWDLPFPPNSVDYILMIYVLSAIRPDRMDQVLCKLLEYLKPGGMVLFRDYGRFDLSQLRFKGNRCVSNNFYVRGEGTFAYFFDERELGQMFSRCGYEIKELQCPKRLQVNRKRQLKMYRVLVQGKFSKPESLMKNQV